ncbi:golgin subfamily A member 7-like [Thomomys bottae]
MNYKQSEQPLEVGRKKKSFSSFSSLPDFHPSDKQKQEESRAEEMQQSEFQLHNYLTECEEGCALWPQQAPVSRMVFIQQDYTSGTCCQFQTKFPAELENQIERHQFEETVPTLNNLYAEAEKLGGQSYLEVCLACLTAYTIFFCMETHYEKVLKKLSKDIQEQNERIYAPGGLLLTDPIERGLRVIGITIYEDRGLSSGR